MAELKHHKILLIDDDLDILDVVSDLLKQENFDVYQASSGPHALEMILGGLDPTLVICDVNMPEMQGPDFVRKCLSVRPQISVVMLTAYSQSEIIIEALRLGAIDYICKPFKSDEFKSKIFTLIEIAKQRQKIVSNAGQPNDPFKKEFLLRVKNSLDAPPDSNSD